MDVAVATVVARYAVEHLPEPIGMFWDGAQLVMLPSDGAPERVV